MKANPSTSSYVSADSNSTLSGSFTAATILGLELKLGGKEYRTFPFIDFLNSQFEFVPFSPRSSPDAHAEHAVHDTFGHRAEIIEPGQMAQFMLHDGQQIDVIDRPRIDGFHLRRSRRWRTPRPRPAWDRRTSHGRRRRRRAR